MGRLVVIIAAFILIVFVAYIVREVIRWVTSDPVAEAVARGRALATWNVETTPLVPDDPESDMNVWVVRSAIVEGVEHVYARHPVGGVHYDDEEFVPKLEALREEAQRRCRSLNAKLDTSPGTM